MSMHKKPLTPLEQAGLEAQGFNLNEPSPLSDAFRHGIAWALANHPSDAVVKLSTLRNEVFEVLQILAMCRNSINADDLGKKLEAALNSTLLEPYPTRNYEDEISRLERANQEWKELWMPIDNLVRPLTSLGKSVSEKVVELINVALAPSYKSSEIQRLREGIAEITGVQTSPNGSEYQVLAMSPIRLIEHCNALLRPGPAIDTIPIEQPKLAVWYGSLPESNGKSNWTAVLHRADDKDFEIFTDGITIDRSEYPDRVRYEADCVRWLIGELKEKPSLLDYDGDKHSGYIYPSDSVVSVVPKHGQECFIGERPVGQFVGIKPESTSFVTFKNGEFRSYHPEQLGFKRPDTSTPPNAEQDKTKIAQVLRNINSSECNHETTPCVQCFDSTHNSSGIKNMTLDDVANRASAFAKRFKGGMVEQPDSAADNDTGVMAEIALSLKTADLCAHLTGNGYRSLKVGDKLYLNKPQRIIEQDARPLLYEDYSAKVISMLECYGQMVSDSHKVGPWHSSEEIEAVIYDLLHAPELEPVEGDLLPCPFCGETPDLPDGNGTQYEMSCECGRACSTVQISDLLTVDERASSTFTNYRYEQKYIDRARDYVIAQWNVRAPLAN